MLTAWRGHNARDLSLILLFARLHLHCIDDSFASKPKEERMLKVGDARLQLTHKEHKERAERVEEAGTHMLAWGSCS